MKCLATSSSEPQKPPVFDRSLSGKPSGWFSSGSLAWKSPLIPWRLQVQIFGDELQDKAAIRLPGRAAMVLFIRLEGKGLELLASGSAPGQKIRAVARCFSIVGVFHATCKGLCRSFGGLFVMAYVKKQGDSLSNGQADDETKMVETASSQAKALGWTPPCGQVLPEGN